VRSNSPQVAIVALATTALLPLFSAPLALADKDYSRGGATDDYAYGPLPPAAPVKDYSENAATGDFSGWRGAGESREPTSASPVRVVTAAEPADFFDWDDAAIGAGVGVVVGGLAAVAVVRRRIPSAATGGLARLTQDGANERSRS
jgi:hypothetical protein